jgi:hypothetical protein
MRFRPNTPFESREPDVTVDAGLPPGTYRVRLEVVGARSGRRSTPMEVLVRVEPRLPIPIPVPVPIPVPPIIR